MIFLLTAFIQLFPNSSMAQTGQVAQGTGVPSQWSSSVSWTNNAESGEDALRGRIEFTPAPEQKGCQAIRMVQIARVEKKLNVDLDWEQGSGEQNRNLLRTKASAQVEAGYFVDHEASNCKPGAACSPYFRDSWPNADESADGTSVGNLKAASLIDYPYGWTSFERISLETCAVCADHFDGTASAVYGCAKWGATWPSIGDRVIKDVSYSAKPSMTFLQALRKFKQFYL